jgi:hypothetical protein
MMVGVADYTAIRIVSVKSQQFRPPSGIAPWLIAFVCSNSYPVS